MSTSIINVVATDGQRTVNWNFPANKTVSYVLDRFKFEPVRGTIRVGKFRINNPENTELRDCPYKDIPFEGESKKQVKITFESVKKPEKPKKPGKADEADEADGDIAMKTVPYSAFSEGGDGNVC